MRDGSRDSGCGSTGAGGGRAMGSTGTGGERGSRMGRDAIRADGRAAASDAAQFSPFAALRGLEALYAEREETRLTESRHELTEEEAWELSCTLAGLERGDHVHMLRYEHGHYVEQEGTVTQVNASLALLHVNGHPVVLADLRELRRLP